MPFKPRCEHLLACSDGRGHVHLVEAGCAPGSLVTFDNECRCSFIKAVAVSLENAILVLNKIKSEGVKLVVGAEPNVLGRAHVEDWAKLRRILLTDGTI